MKDKHLNEQIKNYYQDQKLAPGKLEQLLNLSDANDDFSSESHENDSRVNNKIAFFSRQNLRQLVPKNIFAIAASVCLFVLITLQIAPIDFFKKKELALLVSEEIALNHNKQLSIEYSAKNFSELRNQMQKLDFTPTSSSRLVSTELKFLGARYCSIQGQLAVQIKLANKDGLTQTLYQTQLNNKLQSLPEKIYVVDGVKIKQWQENGLFFGLASTAE